MCVQCGLKNLNIVLLLRLLAVVCQPFTAQSTTQDRIIVEAGARPLLYPVKDYSNCCPETEQRIFNPRIDNVTDLTASSGSGTGAVSWLELNENAATVEDNQIELNVRITVLSYYVLGSLGP